MKNILPLIFVFATLFSTKTFAQYSGGSGTEASPYQIANAEDLIYLSQHSGDWALHFIQTANFDFGNDETQVDWDGDGYADGGGTAGFSPIGNTTTNFTGNYSGQGFTISNLFINRGANDEIGLFGIVHGNLSDNTVGHISNLGLIGGSVTGLDRTGAMVGLLNQYSYLANCFATTHVTGSTDEVGLTGGLVGYIDNHSKVVQSYSKGDVTGQRCVGGFAGGIERWSAVENCYSTGNVVGTSDYVGGFIGGSYNSDTITNCYSVGTVTASTGSSGDFMGSLSNNSELNASFCLNGALNAIGIGSSAGIAEKNELEMQDYNTFTAAGWDFVVETNNGEDDIWDDVDNDYPVLSWQSESDGVLATSYSGGGGTEADPYQIATVEDLVYLSQHSSDWNLHFIQIADIDFGVDETLVDWDGDGSTDGSGTSGFSPIGNTTTQFTGTYNGQKNSIANLFVSRPADDNIALFGWVNAGAELQQIILQDLDITGNNQTAGLLGYATGVPANYITVTQCRVSGTVNGNSQNAGGLAGLVKSYINITQCSSNCNVEGVYCVGGFVGHLYDQYMNSTMIANCYSRGNVTRTTGSTFEFFGAFIGYPIEGQISNCYATGDVYYDGTSNPSNKGFVGAISSVTISNCFFDSEASNQSSDEDATAKTTTEMQDYNTFTAAGWDFVVETDNGEDDIWDDVESDYPVLSWQSESDGVLATSYSGGDGTEAEPYQIATVKDLVYLSQHSGDWGLHFIQTADIAFNSDSTLVDWDGDGSATWDTEDQLGFSPIGDGTTKFTGSYNGQGYEIDYLFINLSANYVALFGNCEGAIANLGLTNVYIKGRTYVGGLAGYLQPSGEIDRCYASGDIKATTGEGGLLCGRSNSTISNSYTINGTVYAPQVAGGFVGVISMGTIENCYARAVAVTEPGTYTLKNAGGFIGWNYGTVNNCYSACIVNEITGSNHNAFCGENNSTITNCFFDSQVGNHSTDVAATGKSTIEMQDYLTFTSAGWDFVVETNNGEDDIWDDVESDYPVLSWQSEADGTLEERYSGGEGTEAAPYQIADIADLMFLSLHYLDWDKHFIQTADIAFNSDSTLVDWDGDGSATWDTEDQLGFSPIGDGTTKFTGSYNGQGYEIDYLFINLSANYVALFGNCEGAIANLGLTNVYIKGRTYVGGLAGYLQPSGEIDRCYASGDIKATTGEGGLLCGRSNSTISNSYTINGTVYAPQVAGGFVGVISMGTIENCYARAVAVTEPGTYTLKNAGGFIGWNYGTVNNCYSACTVNEITGSNHNAFCGENNSTITNCFFDSQVGNHSTDVAATGKSTIEMQDYNTFTAAGWDFVVETDNGENDIWDDVDNDYPVLSWQSESDGVLATSYSGGEGTEADPYQIATVEDLVYLSQHSSDWNLHFIQIADINFGSDETAIDWDGNGSADGSGTAGFSPIGNSSTYFTGEYNGQSYSIENLYINRGSNDYIGFFGYANSATIENLGITEVSITGQNQVGALAGYALATIKNCYTTGNVKGFTEVGGLTGYSYYSVISYCFSQCYVDGINTSIGGFSGRLEAALINNCYSTGNVDGTSYIGGFVGNVLSNTTINKCYCTGEVDGNAYEGGFSVNGGSGSNITVVNCFYQGIYTSGDGGSPKSETRMKDLVTFTSTATSGLDEAWDFIGNPNDDSANDDIWIMNSSLNNGYPAFVYQVVAPVLTTSELTVFTTTTATMGGTINMAGESAITERGVVYSESDETPQIGESGVTKEVIAGTAIGEFSEEITGLSLGTTYYVQAYATNSEGTSYGGVKSFTTKTEVSSIVRVLTNPTNASTVSWTVTFSSSVSGLATSNFDLSNTGLTSPSITNVSGSGTSWTVTASTGNGSGTLGLNMVNDTGLSSGVANLAFTGESYTIDNIAPVLSSSTPADDVTNAYLGGNIILNFDENIAGGTGNITIKKESDGSIIEQIPANDARVTVSTSQVIINPTSILSKGTAYYLEVDATALTDEAGNSFAGISGNTTLNFSTVDVVINEVVTEPVQDWSTNGFNGTVGTGSVNSGTDEWLELFIQSDGVDFTGWTIELNDGTDVSGDLTNSGAFDVSNYIGNGSFTNTASGDYLVLGDVDGAGAMNNSITINLKEPSGAIVDQVTINGNSDDIYNETVQRFANGRDTDDDNSDLTMGLASPGTANTGPTVKLSVSAASITEASGTSTVKATLSGATNQAVSVSLSINASSTAMASDYSLSSTTITIPAGSTEGTVTLTAQQDDIYEENETVVIDISSVTIATEAGTQQQTVTINNDDSQPSVSFTVASQSSTNESGTMTITAELSNPSYQNVSVPFTINGSSTATGSGTDYTVSASPLSIATGNTTADITITVAADALDEENETIIVDMGTPTNATQGITTSHTAAITDDDSTPVVTASQSFDIAEDIANSGAVGTVMATDTDAGTIFSSWTEVGGTGAAIFEINTSTGAITVTDNSNIDHESNASYSLVLTVSDGVNTSASETVAVNINDVNDVSPVITTSQSFDIDEDAANSEVVGTVAATDGDVTATIFSSWTITAGNGDGIFAINGSTGEITVTDNTNLDYESDTQYTLTLTVSDGANTSASEDVTIDINPINDNDPVVTASQSFDIAENIANAETVGTVIATDADAGTTFSSWTEVGGTGADIFEINAGTGAITVTDNSSIDYESKTSYTYTVTVSDGTNTSAVETITIKITDVNDVAPVIIASQIFNVDEDATNSTSIGTVAVTDGDVTATTYSSWTITAGNVDGIFAINSASGEITVADNANLDFETTETYILTLTVSDGGNTSAAETVTVNVNDVIEAATFTIDAIANVNINENTPYTSVTPNITGTPIGTITYTLSGTDAADFSITPSTGVVAMVARNYENPEDANTNNVYEVTITATDDDGNSDSEDWTVTIDDVVEAASFTIDAISNVNINENTPYTSVTPNITGTPIGTITYTLSGTDAADFSINPSTGVVEMVARNYENPEDANTNNVYEVTITATDDDGNSDSEDWTVTIDDVIETATFTIDAIANININENTLYTSVTPNITGTPIGNVTYTLGGTDAADFSITPSTGVVAMVARNYENPEDANTNNVYEVTITATDDDGNSDSEDWTVTIDDVVEAASFTIDAISNVNINENTPYTSVTPNITGTPIGTITYTLSGTDAADFSINPSTGVVTMVARSYEEPEDDNTDNVYEVTITATDDDGNSDSEDWTVTIDDVVESATFTIDAIANVNINENTPYTSVTPNITGTPIGNVTYSLSGTDAADFTINPSTGVVTMVARSYEEPEDDNTDNVYEVTITATDDDGNSDSEDWTLTIDDVVEAASFTIDAIANVNINENTPYTSVAPNITGTPIGNVTYSLSGTDAEDFTINTETGVVSMVARDILNPVDENADNVYEVAITVIDADGNTATEDWTVTVGDNAPPQMNCNRVDFTLYSNGRYILRQRDIEALSAGTTDAITDYENLIIEVTPDVLTCNHVGRTVLAITATDEEGNQASCEVEVQVDAGNATPTIDAIADIRAEAGSIVRVPLSGISDGYDCLDQDISVTVDNPNSTLISELIVDYISDDRTGTINITLAEEQTGTETITVQVEDSEGGIITTSFILTVFEQPDSDNDGVPDEDDAFPNDPEEDTDTDGDGIGDNEDEDDDGNGINDAIQHNSAPVLIDTLDNVYMRIGEVYEMSVSKLLGDVFDDADNDSLSFSVMLENRELPDWFLVTEYADSLNLTFTPAQVDTGSYTIMISASDLYGACDTAVFELVVDSLPVGINNLERIELSIELYPNPSRGMVNIDFDGILPEEVEVAVYSMSGAEVIRKTFFYSDLLQLDLSQQISGMYLIQIKTEHQNVLKKLILNRD